MESDEQHDSYDYEGAVDESLFMMNDRFLRFVCDSDSDSGQEDHLLTIHVSSSLFSLKSKVFEQLFASQQTRDVTAKIQRTEISVIREFVKFMYTRSLEVTSTRDVWQVLLLGDTFQVRGCVKDCFKQLYYYPSKMTLEDALAFLDIPKRLLGFEGASVLQQRAKDFFADYYEDFMRFQQDALNLPLSAFKEVLSTDSLQAPSEDAIYDLVLQWAQNHSVETENRKEIISHHLAMLIRYPFLTSRKLREFMGGNNDFDHDFALKEGVEALLFKTETLSRQQALAAAVNPNRNRKYIARAYKHRPVKIVEFELPKQVCVYLDLNLEECVKLFPSGEVCSEEFDLVNTPFFLSARCTSDCGNLSHSFGLYLCMREPPVGILSVGFEFAARMGSADQFTTLSTGHFSFEKNKEAGIEKLFPISWDLFTSEEENQYFNNGILQLRAELTLQV